MENGNNIVPLFKFKAGGFVAFVGIIKRIVAAIKIAKVNRRTMFPKSKIIENN